QNGLNASIRDADVRAFVLLILCAFGLATAQAAPAPAHTQPLARVTSIRFGGTPDKTRVVIDSDAALKYHVFMLAAGTQRIVIDLPRVRWSIDGLTAESGSGKGDGVVAGYRFAQNTATTSRLVFDLAKPALVTREFSLSPSDKDEHFRIVMDLE